MTKRKVVFAKRASATPGDICESRTASRSGEGGDGYQIAGADGVVSVWVQGDKNAKQMVGLMNLAHHHEKLAGCFNR
jgi:hypothetical protein